MASGASPAFAASAASSRMPAPSARVAALAAVADHRPVPCPYLLLPCLRPCPCPCRPCRRCRQASEAGQRPSGPGPGPGPGPASSVAAAAAAAAARPKQLAAAPGGAAAPESGPAPVLALAAPECAGSSSFPPLRSLEIVRGGERLPPCGRRAEHQSGRERFGKTAARSAGRAILVRWRRRTPLAAFLGSFAPC